MTALPDDEQLRADGCAEQDLGRVPGDDCQGDVHTVRAHDPRQSRVDGLLRLGAPVDVSVLRVHAGQGRIIPRDHGLDARAGERGLANGPYEGI